MEDNSFGKHTRVYQENQGEVLPAPKEALASFVSKARILYDVELQAGPEPGKQLTLNRFSGDQAEKNRALTDLTNYRETLEKSIIESGHNPHGLLTEVPALQLVEYTLASLLTRGLNGPKEPIVDQKAFNSAMKKKLDGKIKSRNSKNTSMILDQSLPRLWDKATYIMNGTYGDAPLID